MYNIIIKLIIAAALLDLGISFSKMEDCSSRACWNQIQKASKKVIKIDWKPISVFPEEAKRFR
ncbi:MAG: hypothetical protein J0M15_13535 [Deltaproteobacteria bacterium]|nr:hypothetical protein [Deltaproteobacteria bacterium]